MNLLTSSRFTVETGRAPLLELGTNSSATVGFAAAALPSADEECGFAAAAAGAKDGFAAAALPSAATEDGVAAVPSAGAESQGAAEPSAGAADGVAAEPSALQRMELQLLLSHVASR